MTIRTPMHPTGGGNEEKKTPAGTVIFESSTPGTYTVTIPTSQNYEITMNGAGGGGAYSITHTIIYLQQRQSAGGNGAKISGTTKITKGNYSVTVGAGGTGRSQEVGYEQTLNGGVGGNTSFANNIASGGGGGHSHTTLTSNDGYDGAAGTATIVSAGLIGTTGGGAAGGARNGGKGGNGYIKITAR